MRNNQPSILDRLEAGIRNKIPPVVANLVSYGTEHAGVAPVVIVANREGTKDQMLAAVSTALNGNAMPIANTFQQVMTNGSPAYVGFVKANVATRIVDDAVVAKMTVMAGNMLLDAEDDSLWKVRDATHGGKVLERHGQDSLSKLLETAKVHVDRAPEMASVSMGNVSVGDYACFIDPVTSNIRYGVVVAAEDTAELHTNPEAHDEEGGETHTSPTDGLSIPEAEVEILPVAGMEPLKVKASLIIMAAEMDGSEKVPEVLPPREGSAKDRMVNYYSRLFRYNTPYFRKMEAIIEQNTSF